MSVEDVDLVGTWVEDLTDRAMVMMNPKLMALS